MKPENGTATFKYDLFGRRIFKSSSSGTSVFTYDGDKVVEETRFSPALPWPATRKASTLTSLLRCYAAPRRAIIRQTASARCTSLS